MDIRNFYIRLSGLTVRIHCRYPQTELFYKEFLINQDHHDYKEEDVPEVSVTREQLQSLYGGSPEAREEVCIRMELFRILISRGRILLHGVSVVLDGKAYLFLAGSGTGKTTHALNWLETFGDRAYILNGDKTLLSFDSDIPGSLLAHGTPWKGKEGLGCSATVPVAGICFLERGSENSLRLMDENEAISSLLHQVIIPRKEPEFSSFMKVAQRISREVPCYRLRCTKTRESAMAAYENIRAQEPLI